MKCYGCGTIAFKICPVYGIPPSKDVFIYCEECFKKVVKESPPPIVKTSSPFYIRFWTAVSRFIMPNLWCYRTHKEHHHEYGELGGQKIWFCNKCASPGRLSIKYPRA